MTSFTYQPLLGSAIACPCSIRSERLSSKHICLYAANLGEHTPEVERLQYRDIPRAVDSEELAFAHDPLMNYSKYTPDYTEKPWHRSRDRANMRVHFSFERMERGRAMLTIEHGTALAILTQAAEKRGDPLDKAVQGMTVAFVIGMAFSYTPQQKMRGRLLSPKLMRGFREAGPRLSTMLVLDGLMTHPDAQGRGYGSALLDVIKAYADAEGRAIILGSSNEMNTGFYEFHGFGTLAKIMVGDDDPTWDDKPFPIRIMVREPNVPCKTEKISMCV